MKKVIDANYFQDPSLEAYLKADKSNYVIFPDYACMEAYKGNALKNISKSLIIVSQFPNQVIVLKGTRDIVKLSLLSGDINKFEDPIQTRDFKIFCRAIKDAVNGDLDLEKQILENGRLATEHFNKILKDIEKIVTAIDQISKSFNPTNLRILRKKRGT